MKIVIADIETNALEYEDINRIHVFSMNWGGKIKSTSDMGDMLKILTRKDVIIVGHNFCTYDVPALEKILQQPIKCQVYDTLAISWYLYPNNPKHGLEWWGEQLGFAKPPIEDWENLTYDEYRHRCESDVEINSRLWHKMWDDLMELYDGNESTIHSLCRYLSFKMRTVALQERNPFKIDLDTLEQNLKALETLRDEKLYALKKVMPTTNVITKVNRPKSPYKMDGTLSVQGLKWKKLTSERGLSFEYDEPIEVIKDYAEPNPQSPQQIKDWLFSLGWKPILFNDGVNGPVPTYLTPDKELCKSVLKLGDAVKHLDDLGVIKHRIGLLKGFLRDKQGEYISCGIHGLASTLRTRHSRIVNLPKPTVPYGEYIRSVLTCDDGYEIVDSDLASLENMIKLDLIYPLNPEKVKNQLTADYDSHLEICLLAGMMTPNDVEYYKTCKKNKDTHNDRFIELDKIRHKGKTTNYSAQYGVGKAKLAKTLEISQHEAFKLLDAYWEANLEAKIVSQNFRTKEFKGMMYVHNPYNKFWYELRSEKDRLSAVIQSTGDFITHLWAKNVIEVSKCVTLIYHDQIDLIVKEGYRKGIEKLLRDSIDKVNKQLKLNVPMDISVNFGKRFSDVH